ncbi:MAG: GntR family transcriptional regulator [Tabrizicola sp.]|nr:GntR family transcriptional regulator [Tabrizicola sp.]
MDTDLQPADNVTAIAERLALAILEHRLAPGTKMSEDDVGEIFGVSRTIVRAAFQRLSHDRLIDLRRNRGAFVAQPTVREALEVFEARALLEPRMARSAAERATRADIAFLRDHIGQEHAAIHARDFGRALYLSGQFHVELVRIADQDTIASFIRQLVSRSSLVIALYWQRRHALCESDAHHTLIDAMARGDGALAEKVMTAHLADLLASLDLRRRTSGTMSLKDALS